MSDPYVLYLLDISCFSGKMEAYLCYEKIPFRRHHVKWGKMAGTIYRNTGHMR